MKRYVRTVLSLTGFLTKRLFRDKTAMFFTFLFPLIFLFVFGSINRGSGDVNFDVVFINHSQTAFARQFEAQARQNNVFKIKDSIKTLDEAKQRMGRGEIDSIIELPKDFGTEKAGVPTGQVVVYYEQASPQTGQTLAGIMQQGLDGTNYKLTHHVDPLTVTRKATKTENLKPFDYTLAGLLGFTILSLSIFGMANGFPIEKKTGRLRRLRATPLKASQLIMATALEYLFVGLISIIMQFIVAMQFFDFQMRGNYLTFLVFGIFSILVMFGFGLAIGGWAKNEQQAAPLTNLVSFPMMFLSGTFFPRFLMPEWLQSITGYLPLTPIIDGLRRILTEGASLLSLGPQLLVMAVWMLVIYALAIKVFRWE